jgi:endonuclease/exonuclease/phosphatase (EEP) superfamily protein YafD
VSALPPTPRTTSGTPRSCSFQTGVRRSSPATSTPSRRIDFVLGPASWTVLDEAVPTSTLSDHLPVVTTFALPAR